MELDDRERRTLLVIARESVRHGMTHQRPLPVEPGLLGHRLVADRGSFVTVYCHGELRGCVGNLAANQPLAMDVATNAFHAAFGDRRFAPLSAAELPDTQLEVSVLSRPEPLAAASEEELHRRLAPGLDGIILTEGRCRATFLPKVWDQLPAPADFMRALKRKAGLPEDYWSASLRVERYRTTVFSET
jgi:AmmeMemoRadiSam system protein A